MALEGFPATPRRAIAAALGILAKMEGEKRAAYPAIGQCQEDDAGCEANNAYNKED